MRNAPLAALFFSCFLLGACSSPSPAPTSSDTPAPSGASNTAATDANADAHEPEDSTDAAEEGPEALRTPTRSGFLKDYSRLEPVQPFKHVLAERAATLGGYKSFIIEAPEVLAKTTIDGKPLNNTVSAGLANDLKTALVQSLAVNYTITDKPGPGVVRVRSAITAVGECLHHPDAAQRRIGGATGEMEIVDSQTGERLGAAVAADAVTTRDPLLKSDDTWYDTRLVFKHWSARLAKALVDAQ
ncbi:MAG: DUF3313 family protein [Phycisphaerales bacterium]